MCKETISAALDKYYDGKSTLEEEDHLFDLLNQDDLDEAFFHDRDQFNFFRQERKVNLSENFDNKLESVILNYEEKPAPRFDYTKNWLSIAAVLLLTVGLTWWFYSSNSTVWLETVSQNNVQKELTLSDNSQVSLNDNSQVIYSEKFADKREIHFQGEGFFDITHDPKRPFLIHTENTLVEVLGTSFNIRNYADESTMVVSVVSGKVAFSSIQNGLQEKIFLLKGEQGIYNKETNLIYKSAAKPNQIAWKTKKLTFDNALMRNVIRDLERYYDIGITADNEAFLNCHFKGNFDNAKFDTVLDVLEYSMGISYEMQGSKYILKGEGCNNDALLNQ